MSDYIDLNTVAKEKFLPLTRRRLSQLCEQGVFRTAFKPGTKKRTSKWLVSRAEILQWRINGHPNPFY